MRKSFTQQWKKSAMSGSSLLSLLPMALMVAGTIANAAERRVVVPVGQIPDVGQVAAVIPGERELLYMLLMNAAFIIWNLVKDIWAAHKKKGDHSAQDIAEMKLSLQTVLSEMKTMNKKLENVPTEKEVELKIYQIIRTKDL